MIFTRLTGIRYIACGLTFAVDFDLDLDPDFAAGRLPRMKCYDTQDS